MTYNEKAFDYITLQKDEINQVANQLGVSSAAIAGSIAEEANSIFNKGHAESFVNDVGEWVANTNHESLLDNYNEVHLPENRDMLVNTEYYHKLLNPTLNDVGLGNIKVSTAITLLNNYVEANPNSDPLGIKYLQNDYSQLVDRLIDPTDNATIIFAGLMNKEGQDFFSKTHPNWDNLTQLEQDALIVTHYNLGTEKVVARYEEATNNGEDYNPQPGSGGTDHLENATQINDALNSELTGKEVFNVDTIDQLSIEFGTDIGDVGIGDYAFIDNNFYRKVGPDKYIKDNYPTYDSAADGGYVNINGKEYTETTKPAGDILKSINPEAKPEDIAVLNAGSIQVSGKEGEVSYFIDKETELEGGDGNNYKIDSL